MTFPDQTLAHELEAALDWWQMAGVDHDFSDDATTWLAERPLAPAPGEAAGEARAARGGRDGAAPGAAAANQPAARRLAPVPAAPAHAQATRRDLLGDSPPADLAAFHNWWMTAPDLAPSRGFARVPPRGPQGAALMVLVPQPEAEDDARLLSGPQGRLLANILAAMGLDESAVYLAAALPSHTPMADLPMLAAGGMDAVTLHHVRLAAPARLLAFGAGLAPMLGGLSDQPLREINQNGCKVPATLSESLDTLMNMPRLKARFWRRWMEWSATV